MGISTQAALENVRMHYFVHLFNQLNELFLHMWLERLVFKPEVDWTGKWSFKSEIDMY